MQRPRLPRQASGLPEGQRKHQKVFQKFCQHLHQHCQNNVPQIFYKATGWVPKSACTISCRITALPIYKACCPWRDTPLVQSSLCNYLVPVSMNWQMQDFTWCKLPSAWRKKCVRSASWRSMTDCSARSSAFSFSDPLSRSAPTTFWSAPFGAFCEAELRKVSLRREDLYHMYRCLPSNSLHCYDIQVCLL